MATNYPGSLDSGTQQPSPSSSTEMDDSGFEHDVVHTNHSSAIIALETKVGTGDSNAVASSVLAGTGSGTSGWTTTPTVTGLTVNGDTSSTGHFTAQSGGADGGIVLGQAFSSSYVGLRTGNMGEASADEYLLISDGTHTLVSAPTNGDVYIRGGANNSSCQILLDTSENNVAVTGTLSVSGIVTLSDEIKGGSGSAADPVFTFASDGNTGMYLQAADQLGFTTGGVERLRIGSFGIRGDDSGDVYNFDAFRGNNGSNSAPTFSFDADSDAGMYLTTAGTLGFTTGSVLRTTINSSGVTVTGDVIGTSDTNFFVKNDSGEEILFQESSNNLYFKTNGTYRAYFLSTGHFRPYADNTYDIGTSGVRWDDIFATNGTIQTSDERDKTDVTPLNRGLAFIDELKPVSFRWSHRGDSGPLTRTHWGFLAQDVAATLGDAASASAVWTHSEAREEVDAEGATVQILDHQGLRMSELIAPVVKAIQELSTRVVALEAA